MKKWFEINLGWFFINGMKQEEWNEYLKQNLKKTEGTPCENSLECAKDYFCTNGKCTKSFAQQSLCRSKIPDHIRSQLRQGFLNGCTSIGDPLGNWPIYPFGVLVESSDN